MLTILQKGNNRWNCWQICGSKEINDDRKKASNQKLEAFLTLFLIHFLINLFTVEKQNQIEFGENNKHNNECYPSVRKDICETDCYPLTVRQ